MKACGDEVETQIHEIWRETLGVRYLDPDENFFDAGGTSILATRLAARLRSRISDSITVQDILRFPTVRALAQQICRPRGGPEAAVATSRASRQCAAFDQFRTARPSRLGEQSI